MSQLQEAKAGDTTVAVNVGNRLVLPVLQRCAVRFHRGQSYLEQRASDFPPSNTLRHGPARAENSTTPVLAGGLRPLRDLSAPD